MEINQLETINEALKKQIKSKIQPRKPEKAITHACAICFAYFHNNKNKIERKGNMIIDCSNRYLTSNYIIYICDFCNHKYFNKKVKVNNNISNKGSLIAKCHWCGKYCTSNKHFVKLKHNKITRKLITTKNKIFKLYFCKEKCKNIYIKEKK